MFLDGRDESGYLIQKITDCAFKCNEDANIYSVGVVSWMMCKGKEEHLSGNVPEKWKQYESNWLHDDGKELFITISTEDAGPVTPTSTRK